MKIFEPVSAVSENMYPSYFRTLASLRFFAAFWVMLFHFSDALPGGSLKESGFVSNGTMAVDFFFILSGFIIAHIYKGQFYSGQITKVSFYIKRLARIYPVHLFTLCIYVAAIFLARGLGELDRFPSEMSSYYEGLSFDRIMFNAFLVHGWGVEPDLFLNKPSWSISAEWFVYLCFPFFILAGRKAHFLTWLLAGAVLAVILWWLTPLIGLRRLTLLTFDYSILRILPEFLIGMGIYDFGRRYRLSVKAQPLFLTLFLLTLFLAECRAEGIYLMFLFAAIIYLAAEVDRQGHNGLLQDRGLVYMGEASYSLYMIHFPVLDFTYVFIGLYMYGGPIPSEAFALIWAAMFPAAIILSILMYMFVEKPSRNFINRRFAGAHDS